MSKLHEIIGLNLTPGDRGLGRGMLDPVRAYRSDPTAPMRVLKGWFRSQGACLGGRSNPKGVSCSISDPVGVSRFRVLGTREP